MLVGSEHVGFLGELDLSCLLSLGHHVLVLNTHNTTTPGSSEGDVVVEVGGEVVLEVGEVGEVFLSDIGEGNAGSSLGVAELSESCLTSDEAEWDVVLSAESWQEDHDLEWVNIVGHDDELGFAFLDESGDVVETEFKVEWLWGAVSGSATLSGFSFTSESVLLLFAGLWGVLGEELEELGGLVLVDGLLELAEGWWGLESQEHDSLLSLDSDVLWPFDESGEVSGWLNITTDSVVSCGLGEKG